MKYAMDMFKIARFRLITAYGGIPTLSISRRIVNDTGSDIQTIFVSDLAQLQYNSLTYIANLGQRPVSTARGLEA